MLAELYGNSIATVNDVPHAPKSKLLRFRLLQFGIETLFENCQYVRRVAEKWETTGECSGKNSELVE